MANNFRNTPPKRTCTKSYVSYRSYKSYLADDFNSRCGYTDCPDFWFGGENAFHIDHFKPKSKNPELETTYSNLVYCCSYVNILKSNDEGDYLDPCDIDLNNHFERDDIGNIVPKVTSKKAIYMFTKLKLYLRRYQVIWMLDNLILKMEQLEVTINNSKNEKIKIELHILNSQLSIELRKYIKYLSVNQ